MLPKLYTLGLFLLASSWTLVSAVAIAIPPKLPNDERVLSRAEDGTGTSHWLYELQTALSVMQDRYWDIDHWPSTNHWINAFLNTLTVASDTSLATGLGEYNDSVAETDHDLNDQILQRFQEIEAHYSGEVTDQIVHEAYDDIQWVVLEWLEAIKFIERFNAHVKPSLGQGDLNVYARRAHDFYSIVRDKFDPTTCNGGLTWDPDKRTYKNAITNELFIASSIGMYLYLPEDKGAVPYLNTRNMAARGSTMVPRDPRLLDNAVKAYEWFKAQNFRNAQGFIVDGFHISEGQSSCNQRNDMVYTYNQGVLLSGLRCVWEATANRTYINDAFSLIDTVIKATGWSEDVSSEWSGLGRNGILEEYCDAHGDCNAGARTFKGIFFHHFSLFCEPLPTIEPLLPGLTHIAPDDLFSEHRGKCDSYIPWIEHNANAALDSRESSSIINSWWGADPDKDEQSYTKDSASLLTAAVPPPGMDIRNRPWLLDEPFWACEDRIGCNSIGRDRRNDRNSRSAALAIESSKARRDEGGRTVETQASGVAVIKAAYDFNAWRDSSPGRST